MGAVLDPREDPIHRQGVALAGMKGDTPKPSSNSARANISR